MLSIGRWNTVKMLITLKLMHRFSAVPIKIPTFFHSLQLGSKFIMQEQWAKKRQDIYEETCPIGCFDLSR